MSSSSVKPVLSRNDGARDTSTDERRADLEEKDMNQSRRSSTEMTKGEMRSITEYRYNDIGEVIEIVQSFSLEKKRGPSKPMAVAQKDEDGEVKVRLNPQDGSYRGGQDRGNVRRGRKFNRSEQSFGVQIRNLSPSTTNRNVEELTKSCGLISKIYVARDNVTGHCRGFAYVDFKSRADASAAIEKLNGYGYNHRFLKANWSRRKFDNPNEETQICYPSH